MLTKGPRMYKQTYPISDKKKTVTFNRVSKEKEYGSCLVESGITIQLIEIKERLNTLK